GPTGVRSLRPLTTSVSLRRPSTFCPSDCLWVFPNRAVRENANCKLARSCVMGGEQTRPSCRGDLDRAKQGDRMMKPKGASHRFALAMLLLIASPMVGGASADMLGKSFTQKFQASTGMSTVSYKIKYKTFPSEIVNIWRAGCLNALADPTPT